MGVRGTGGVGGGVARHQPSHIAYYVALVGILALLAMLLLYFFYFFIRKVQKLSNVDTQTLTTTTCRPPPATTAVSYPVQPVVRESASEMAKLCKQLPPPGKGGTVFPTSTSPAAIRTDTGDADETMVAPGAVGIPSATDANVPPIPIANVTEPFPVKAPPVITVVPADSVTAQ